MPSPPLVRTGFAGLHLLVAHHVFEDSQPKREMPLHDSLQTGLVRCPSAAALVADQEHLRGGGKYSQDFPDDAIGGDDGHVGLDAVVLALVDEDRAGLLTTTSPDHLGGFGLLNVLFLNTGESAGTAGLGGVFGHARLLET